MMPLKEHAIQWKKHGGKTEGIFTCVARIIMASTVKRIALPDPDIMVKIQQYFSLECNIMSLCMHHKVSVALFTFNAYMSCLYECTSVCKKEPISVHFTNEIPG